MNHLDDRRVDGLGNMVAVLADAEPAQPAGLYRRFGMRFARHPDSSGPFDGA